MATQADLDALNTAIEQGVQQVMYGNKMVIYRSLDDMLRARDIMMRNLGLTKKTHRIYAKHNKDL